MTSWRPHPSPTRYILAVLPLVCIPVEAWLWELLAGRAGVGDFGFETFLCGLAFFLTLVLLVALVYWAWCAFTISYALDEQNLTLRCGGVRQVIPLASITGIHGPGERIGGKRIAVRWQGLTDAIPGYFVGAGSSPQLGRIITVSTMPAAGQVFVSTRQVTFGLSPYRPLAFMEELNRRIAGMNTDVGAACPQSASPTTQLRGISAWGAPLWSDRQARYLMLAGLALCVLFFGYISLVYNNLPPILPLHWNSQGQIDRLGDPKALLRLPVFALGVWLVNVLVGLWALRRERAATLFLLAGAATAPVVFAAGALSIVLRTL